MLMLETDLARFDPITVQILIDSLPATWQQRIIRKKPSKARIQSAVAYSLLRTILQSEFGVYDLPDIETNDCGKPFLKDCPLYFSISHCNAAVAVIVEEHPVAVDVQDILSDSSGRLKARLGLSSNTDSRTLTEYWTRLEASEKLDGKGIGTGRPNSQKILNYTETTDYGDFIACVAHYKR